MLFVGHISIAFLLTYAISKKFVLKDISISFAMFLSTLPDIDLVFSLFGTEIGHRSITHSAIICLSHIIIGDLVVGPINLLYPIGDFIVSGGIMFNTISGTITEGILFGLIAIIILKQSLHKDNTNSSSSSSSSKQRSLLVHYSTLA